MAGGINVKGKKTKRGERMTKGTYKLVKGRKVFTANLIDTINFGRKRIALFSVRKVRPNSN
jgi:hypothetical protein